MAKIPKRIVNSYNAYLNYRQTWSDKGYGLDRELTLKEYEQVHKALSHGGEQHIARRAAADERTFTRSEASGVIRRLKYADQYDDVDEDALNELRKTYKKSKDIYGLELTPDEITSMEDRRRNYWLDRGKTPKHTIQANARAKFFDVLRDAGLSYKEAEKVLYG